MNILGISTGHDSGACIVVNGRLITAINEERLSRIKNHVGFPLRSIKKVLLLSNIKISELQYIAIEGKKIDPQNFGEEFLFKNKKKKFLGYLNIDKLILGTEIGIYFVRFILGIVNFIQKKKIKDYFYKNNFNGKFELIEHHLAHAASAYFSQEKNEGLVITMDAGGEGYCSHVYIANNNKIKLVHKILAYNSLAIYYGYITKILGFTPLRHEGKVLGLSASGESKIVENKLRNFIYFDKKKLNFINKGGYYNKAYLKLQKILKEYSKQDIAAGIQSVTEKLMVEYINCLLEKFSNNKKTNIFLAGGIFANIRLNQKISNLPNVKHCYVFPNMGDGGLGAGCALDTSFRHNELSFRNRQSMSLGSNYTSFNKDLISNSKYEILNCSNVYKFIASKLNEKKIIGIFQGKMEYGPRALGNRSIICSAKDNAINNILNHKLKRSEFMPFAPCVLNEDFSKFFESNMEPEDFEYMTFTCKTKKICEDLVPAIVHIDKTARPQTVYKEKNNFLYTLLSEYKKITGFGLLINTSFNVHEEPIVESCEDALRAFEMSKLDYLVLENLVIQIKK